MVWCDYPSNFYVPEEHAAWTVLSNASKMGTQALWCIQCPPNGLTVDAVNFSASSVEEFDYEGHSITPRKRVPLGPDFQAELPKRLLANSKSTCKADCELDGLRCLGERALRASHLHQDCSCEFQDTLECVRLHIEEKRDALKTELGEAFSMWGFDEMGEIVAEKWSREEQSAFQELVRRNPESFWHELFEYFPTKCMTDFVSYYFNVFVLRRRAIQNRVNPDKIDSDDDEMDLESDERDSDSMLESNDEVGHDAVSEDEDEDENCSMSWAVKDSSGKCLQGVERGGGEESGESSLGSGSLHDQMASPLKESSSDGCCGTSNEEDKSQAWELLSWDTKSHVNTVVEQNDKEAWASPSLHSTQELISTKGMMEEFFGNE